MTSAAETTSESRTETPAQTVVQQFLSAFERNDMDAALALLDDDAVYQNVPLPPDKGIERIERTLRGMTRFVSKFEVRMHHIAATDGVVLTERTDVLQGPMLDLEFWVCGTFEVKDGKITLWRDYFDPATFTWQLLTSPVRKLLRRGR